MTVSATDDWMASGITVGAQNTLWIDSNAVGIWGQGPTQPNYNSMDANGMTGLPTPNMMPWAVDGNASIDSLIACIGPTPPTVSDGGPQPGNWDMFEVGDYLANYPMNQTEPYHLG